MSGLTNKAMFPNPDHDNPDTFHDFVLEACKNMDCQVGSMEGAKK